MGMLIGSLVGFFVFSLPGALMGFLFGGVFDLLNKKFKFTLNGFEAENPDGSLIEEYFPLLAAEVVRSGGLDRSAVLIVKSLMIQYFGVNQSRQMMSIFRIRVENGYTLQDLNEALQTIHYSLYINDKMNLVNILYQIVQLRGRLSKSELDTIKRISMMIGVQIRGQNTYDNNYYESGYRNSPQNIQTKTIEDYYQILGLSPDSSVEEIKKRYRMLCKQYHPDIVTHLPENQKKESEEKMKQIIDAYEEIRKDKNFH